MNCYYKLILLLLLLLLSIVNSFISINKIITTTTTTTTNINKFQIKDNNNNDYYKNEEYMIKLFEDTYDKVVYISTLTQAFNPLTFNFFEIDSQSGSGFIWNNTNMIVTNYHVIEQSYKSKSDVQVTFLGNTNTIILIHQYTNILIY